MESGPICRTGEFHFNKGSLLTIFEIFFEVFILIGNITYLLNFIQFGMIVHSVWDDVELELANLRTCELGRTPVAALEYGVTASGWQRPHSPFCRGQHGRFHDSSLFRAHVILTPARVLGWF